MPMVREDHYSSSTILVRRMTKYTQKKTYSIEQTEIHIQNKNSTKYKIMHITKIYSKYKNTHSIKPYSQNTKYILSKYKIYTQNKSIYVHKINSVNKIK